MSGIPVLEESAGEWHSKLNYGQAVFYCLMDLEISNRETMTGFQLLVVVVIDAGACWIAQRCVALHTYAHTYLTCER